MEPCCSIRCPHPATRTSRAWRAPCAGRSRATWRRFGRRRRGGRRRIPRDRHHQDTKREPTTLGTPFETRVHDRRAYMPEVPRFETTAWCTGARKHAPAERTHNPDGRRLRGAPVRFDVAGAGDGVMESPKRARSRKRLTQPRGVLHTTAPVPDPTAQERTRRVCAPTGTSDVGRPAVTLVGSTRHGAAHLTRSVRREPASLTGQRAWRRVEA